jgi:hypothetical protein
VRHGSGKRARRTGLAAWPCCSLRCRTTSSRYNDCQGHRATAERLALRRSAGGNPPIAATSRATSPHVTAVDDFRRLVPRDQPTRIGALDVARRVLAPPSAPPGHSAQRPALGHLTPSIGRGAVGARHRPTRSKELRPKAPPIARIIRGQSSREGPRPHHGGGAGLMSRFPFPALRDAPDREITASAGNRRSYDASPRAAPCAWSLSTQSAPSSTRPFSISVVDVPRRTSRRSLEFPAAATRTAVTEPLRQSLHQLFQALARQTLRGEPASRARSSGSCGEVGAAATGARSSSPAILRAVTDPLGAQRRHPPACAPPFELHEELDESACDSADPRSAGEWFAARAPRAGTEGRLRRIPRRAPA